VFKSNTDKAVIFRYRASCELATHASNASTPVVWVERASWWDEPGEIESYLDN